MLKMMVGNNLKDTQLQQIVDKTILLYDKVDSFPYIIDYSIWRTAQQIITMCHHKYSIPVDQIGSNMAQNDLSFI